MRRCTRWFALRLRMGASRAAIAAVAYPLLGIALLSASAARAATPTPSTLEVQPVAVLQGLDKVTARVSEMSVQVGETVVFGTLSVRVRTCLQSPPVEPPESVVFLEISDERPDGAVEPVFSGWMFASSPALSSLQHPVYDIWLATCADEVKVPQEPEVDSVLPIIPPRPPQRRP